MQEPHHVIVILEAKPEHINDLSKSLQHISILSQQEDSNISYQVFQDPNQPVYFSLVETWKSAQMHEQQFSKDYILEFVKNAENWLAKPFTHFMGQQLQPSTK